MSKPSINPEEWVVSLLDVKRLYISMWKRLIKWAFLGGVAFFLYFGSTEVLYQAEGTFKEAAERTSQEHFFKEMFGGLSLKSQPQAASLMKSNQVLRPLIENLGAQIQPVSSEWNLFKRLRRYREAWRAEKGRLLDDVDPFVFSKVHYDGLEELPFFLKFQSENEFIVLNERKEEVGLGIVGRPFQFGDVSFTVFGLPKRLKLQKCYPFVASNWIEAVEDIRSRIKIKSHKDNLSILVISAIHRDRHLATRIANELMVEFQAYLKREYDAVAKMQIGYLEQKQNQIFGKMNQLFEEHIDYMGKNLSENGFAGLEEETQNLLMPHHQMQTTLLGIDIELKRLSETKKERKAIPIAEDGPFSHVFNQVSNRIQDLKQQRDLIELSLAQEIEPTLQARSVDLKKIRQMRFQVESLIQEIDQGRELASYDLNPGLVHWAKSLENPEEREDFIEYLENYARLLSMREKMLQERVFCNKPPPRELEGMDLGSVRGLFLQYNNKLDAAEASLRHFAKLKKEALNPNFELASLSTALQDSVSQKIIADASHLEVLLKDEKHHSAKEAERWKEEIALQRKVLTDHFEQLMVVEELNIELLRDKMLGLQRLSLDCINQQISVLLEQMDDAIEKRKKSLLVEKEILESKTKDLRASIAAVLPEKWKFEKWLGIKTAMVNKVMETVTEVVESKTMSNQMHHVESKPLDLAIVPISPQAPHLYKMTCLGALATALLVFSFAFIQKLLEGFPLTHEKIKTLQLPFSGPVSSLCDGRVSEPSTGSDLEAIRKMISFSADAKVVGLVMGKGPDYSYNLCENLARRQAHPIVVRCDFNAIMRKEDEPGVYQVWQGEKPLIRKEKGFDYITAGQFSPYGTEILESEAFGELISSLKSRYTHVFLLLRSPLVSMEAQAALRLCEKAVVTISGEQIEELTPFVRWGYDEDNCRITFITSA